MANAPLSAHAYETVATKRQPATPVRLAADFVLIGPSVNPDLLVRTFAVIGSALARAPASPTSPRATLEIPTTNVKIWVREDDAVVVEVVDHTSSKTTQIVLKSSLGVAA